MEARFRRAGLLIAVAALCSMHGVALATDGTITFLGSIVAPGFVISGSPGKMPVAAKQLTVSRDVAAVSIAFTPQPGIVSGAVVKLLVNDGAASRMDAAALDTISARLVNNTGRTSAPDANGHFHLSNTGGVVLLAKRPGNVPSANKPVTLVVNYD